MVLAADGGGIVRVDLDGGRAARVERVLTGAAVRTVATDPRDPRVAFAAFERGGLARSRDGGRTWAASGLDDVLVRSIAASAAEPGLVFAGAKPAALHVSRDGGDSWAEVEGFRRIRTRALWLTPAEWPPSPFVQALALSPADPRVILAGVEVAGVLRSEDGGCSWRRGRGAILDCHSLASDPGSPERFCQGGAGWGAPAAWSVDAGRTWRKIRAPDRAWYGWAAGFLGDGFVCSATTGPGRAHGSGPAHARIVRVDGDGRAAVVAGGLAGMPYALLPETPQGALAVLGNGELWRIRDDACVRVATGLGRPRAAAVSPG